MGGLDIRGPRRGEEDGLRGERGRHGIVLTCGACGYIGPRDSVARCPSCAGTVLVTRPKAIVERARGTQLVLVGYTSAALCTGCDAEEPAHSPKHDARDPAGGAADRGPGDPASDAARPPRRTGRCARRPSGNDESGVIVSDELMQIGEVAERTALSLRTIRYYEEVGLVVPSARSQGGFRLYTEDDVDRLLVVKRMKPLEFSLEEMRDLLDVVDRVRAADDDAERAALLERLAMYREACAQRIAALRQQLATAEAFADELRRVPTRRRAATRRS